MRGDINAVEVYQDKELLTRLGYGMLDVPVGSTGGVGFEDVRKYSHIDNEEEDVKMYRRRVYHLTGRYFTNDLSRALWYKFQEHKWVLSEQAGQEISLEEAVADWMQNHSHDFFKEWAFQQEVVPFRLRYTSEPQRGWVGLTAGLVVPQIRELLEVGFGVPAIMWAVMLEVWGGPQYNYLRVVARLSGHRVKGQAEAAQRQAEVNQLEQYLSQQTGQQYGAKAATIEYYRRLNLVAEFEGKNLCGNLILA